MIELSDETGRFTADVADEEWPLVGGLVTVRQSVAPHGPWTGQITKITPAQLCERQWTLASSEQRTAVEVRHADPVTVGTPTTVTYGGRRYQAHYTTAREAAAVTVAYRIQSGALRRRELLFLGHLDGYGQRLDNGKIALIRLPAL